MLDPITKGNAAPPHSPLCEIRNICRGIWPARMDRKACGELRLAGSPVFQAFQDPLVTPCLFGFVEWPHPKHHPDVLGSEVVSREEISHIWLRPGALSPLPNCSSRPLPPWTRCLPLSSLARSSTPVELAIARPPPSLLHPAPTTPTQPLPAKPGAAFLRSPLL